MRRLLALLAAGALTVMASSANAATPGETVMAFHAALAAGKLQQAGELLSPKVHIYEAGHVERSREEYLAHHLPADAAFAKATSSKTLAHSERFDGSLAVVMRETETHGRYKGADVHLFGTETMLLEKAGDGWMIIHVHWSSRKGR